MSSFKSLDAAPPPGVPRRGAYNAAHMKVFDELNPPARLLLGPGPSPVHPRVMRALGAPVLGHLDPELLRLLDDTRGLLRDAFRTGNELTLAVSGTGMAGMEAVLGSLLEPGDRLVVCAAGFFGHRMAELAEPHGRRGHEGREGVGRGVHARGSRGRGGGGETEGGGDRPRGDLDRRASADGRPRRDRPPPRRPADRGLRDVARRACRSRSTAGVRTPPTRARRSASGCPSGMAPVTVSPRAREVMAARTRPAHGWYLDLDLLERYWGGEHAYHHTISSPLVYALREGLRLVAEEGLEARWERHRTHAEMLWDGLEAMGLALHVADPALRVPSLTTVRVPEGVDEAQVRGAAARRVRDRDRGRPRPSQGSGLADRPHGPRLAEGQRHPAARRARGPAEEAVAGSGGFRSRRGRPKTADRHDPARVARS